MSKVPEIKVIDSVRLKRISIGFDSCTRTLKGVTTMLEQLKDDLDEELMAMKGDRVTTYVEHPKLGRVQK